MSIEISRSPRRRVARPLTLRLLTILAACVAMLAGGMSPGCAGAPANGNAGDWRLPAPSGDRSFVGEHRVFVVPAYWSGSAPDPLDQTSVSTRIAEASSYYSAISGGRMTAKLGWVSGWQKLNLTSAQAGS